jgi:hypothetical protein
MKNAVASLGIFHADHGVPLKRVLCGHTKMK